MLVISSGVIAASPTCSSAYGGYCNYEGKVQKVYINSGGLILIYFNKAIDVSVASEAGFTITNGSAAAFTVTKNPDFAKMFYSTALAAQASGRNVTIQMTGVNSGYLEFDRIWLAAP